MLLLVADALGTNAEDSTQPCSLVKQDHLARPIVGDYVPKSTAKSEQFSVGWFSLDTQAGPQKNETPKGPQRTQGGLGREASQESVLWR